MTVSKSSMIREYLEANPGAMPREVVAALQANNVVVSTALVSGIKCRSRGKPKGHVRRGRPRKESGSEDCGPTCAPPASLLAQVQATKAAAIACGGFDQLESLITALKAFKDS